MKPRTLITGALVLAAAGALVAWSFRPDPVPVDLATVTRSEMLVTVNADGRTRIRDVYEIASPITGSARRSPVRVGDRVVEGKTVVAVVEPAAPTLLDARSRASAEAAFAEAQAALEVTKSRVKQAEEDLTYANTQFARTAELVSRGVVSQRQLEDATQSRAIKEAALEAARSSQAMAEGALARARAALIEPDPDPEHVGNGGCCVELHAPVDGVVLEVASMSERPITLGAPLLTIGRPDDLEIVADVLSSDAVRIAPGSLAYVERWGGEATLEAILRRVEPSARTKVSALGIEEQRVDIVFDLLNPPAERPGLGDGFAVFLRIVEWRGENEVQVPVSALFRDGKEWSVFRAKDGIAELVPVTIGRRNGSHAQVLGGLSVGDRVVTHPNDRVQSGTVIVDRAELE